MWRIGRINAILEIHPSFHAGASVKLITNGHHNTCALQRCDASGKHRLLILANLNTDSDGQVAWHGDFNAFGTDLLTGDPVHHVDRSYALKPGQVLCLTHEPDWVNQVLMTLAIFVGNNVSAIFQIDASIGESRFGVARFATASL